MQLCWEGWMGLSPMGWLTGQGNTGASTRGLVHLSVHQSALGLRGLGTKLDDTLWEANKKDSQGVTESLVCRPQGVERNRRDTQPRHTAMEQNWLLWSLELDSGGNKTGHGYSGKGRVLTDSIISW